MSASPYPDHADRGQKAESRFSASRRVSRKTSGAERHQTRTEKQFVCQPVLLSYAEDSLEEKRCRRRGHLGCAVPSGGVPQQGRPEDA